MELIIHFYFKPLLFFIPCIRIKRALHPYHVRKVKATRERERAGKVSLMQNKAIRQAVLISNNNRRSSNRVIDIGQGVWCGVPKTRHKSSNTADLFELYFSIWIFYFLFCIFIGVKPKNMLIKSMGSCSVELLISPLIEGFLA